MLAFRRDNGPIPRCRLSVLGQTSADKLWVVGGLAVPSRHVCVIPDQRTSDASPTSAFGPRVPDTTSWKSQDTYGGCIRRPPQLATLFQSPWRAFASHPIAVTLPERGRDSSLELDGLLAGALRSLAGNQGVGSLARRLGVVAQRGIGTSQPPDRRTCS